MDLHETKWIIFNLRSKFSQHGRDVIRLMNKGFLSPTLHALSVFAAASYPSGSLFFLFSDV